jgi:UDP-N-acetylglucosamine:LPS N-acetylglucosamine transferase
MDNGREVYLGIVTSKGGHLIQILQLRKVFKEIPSFWITFKGEDTAYFLNNEKVYYAYFPESRNIVNFFKNLLLSFFIFKKEKPTHLISSGAGIAVPFFLVGKVFFKTKNIFIEPYDFVAYPSLTGKILYNLRIVDLFLVQHKIQKKWFKKTNYWGSLF